MTRSVRQLTSQLSWAADIARNAPSIFNTQPWSWRVKAGVLELWADSNRHLDVVDPDGRLLTISCGTALHHARVALAAGGDDVLVQRLPDEARPDLLARIAIKAPRVASDRDVARLHATRHRRTDRRPFTGDPVPAFVLDGLRAAAEEEDAHLRVVPATDVAVLASAASTAARAEVNDAAYRAQLARWTHGWRWTSDGVPIDTVPAPSGRRVPLREFYLDRTDIAALNPAEAAAGAPTAEEDSDATYAIVWGDDDRPYRWLRAGEAVSAVLLDATTAGVASSPMSDLIEVERTREVLRTRLLAGLGQPYLVLRMGYPHDGPPPATPRRPSDAVVVEDEESA